MRCALSIAYVEEQTDAQERECAFVYIQSVTRTDARTRGDNTEADTGFGKEGVRVTVKY